MSKHNCDNPECAVCALGLEAVKTRDREAMEKFGWTAHIVVDDPDVPYGFNYHTHGFPETFQCPDMQIVLPLPKNMSHTIMHTIVTLMREGRRFRLGEIADGVLVGHSVTFASAKELDREVYRVILPDKSGDLNQDTMDKVYRDQWLDCSLSK